MGCFCLWCCQGERKEKGGEVEKLAGDVSLWVNEFLHEDLEIRLSYHLSRRLPFPPSRRTRG